MALSKHDKEWIELTVKTAIQDSLSPLSEQVHEHESTLYGKGGQNGLRGQVKYLNRFAWLLTGGLILAGSLAGAVKLDIL
jgi:hypothetical protein